MKIIIELLFIVGVCVTFVLSQPKGSFDEENKQPYHGRPVNDKSEPLPDIITFPLKGTRDECLSVAMKSIDNIFWQSYYGACQFSCDKNLDVPLGKEPINVWGKCSKDFDKLKEFMKCLFQNEMIVCDTNVKKKPQYEIKQQADAKYKLKRRRRMKRRMIKKK